MSRTTRFRAAALGVALLAVLGACGTGGGTVAVAPVSETDLFRALPAPSAAPDEPASPPPPGAGQTPAPRPASGAGTPSGPATGAVDWRASDSDDFGGAKLDRRKWLPYNSVGGFGTGFRRPSAITQSDGSLRITARGDVSGGLRHAKGQLYGRWEVRARTDPGRGFGSAILLWPDSERFPEDGEIDIMEVPHESRDLAHFVVHWGRENNIHGTAVRGDYTRWHTFAVEWLPDRITWYVDGLPRYETRDKARIPKKPMHLAIQLDQGPKKDWIPARDATTPEEISLEVDWVKVWKR